MKQAWGMSGNKVGQDSGHMSSGKQITWSIGHRFGQDWVSIGAQATCWTRGLKGGSAADGDRRVCTNRDRAEKTSRNNTLKYVKNLKIAFGEGLPNRRYQARKTRNVR